MNSTRNIITLPISHSILEQIIDFLYTDECKAIENCNDIDFIVSLLVVSDQLFIERLKELCEISLSSLLTLRNASQMLQLACIYNAPQLKICVMEFISLNLSAILESHTLESLDEEILDDLTNFYSQWNNNLSKRLITPFSDAPNDETVKNVSDLNPIVLKSDDSDQENEIKTPIKSSKKKVRVRKNSENNKNKLKDDNNVNILNGYIKEEIVEQKIIKNDEKWVKILTEKEKHQKIVLARLKAVASAKEEILNNPNSPNNFTKLTKSPVKNIPMQMSPATPISSPIFSFSPLQSPNSSFIDSPTLKSPVTYDVPIVRASKISQKQRKKLALGEQLDIVCKKSSFVESVQNESPVLSTSPKNPWRKIEVPVPEPEVEKKQNFVDIIADEKKQKENWTKMRTKPLIYTQMEDRAIEELLRFYNADRLSDEHITIHRVDKGIYSAPLWVHANKSTK